MSPKLILLMILIVLVVVFAIQNVAPVEIKFFSGTVSMSKALLLTVTFLIGVVVGWVAAWVAEVKGGESQE